MSDQNLLFLREGLDIQLRARQRRIGGVVDSIPKEQFLASTDQDLVEHIAADLVVEPVILHEEAATMDQQETHVDVSGDPLRVFSPGHVGSFLIPGTQVDIEIPFSGDRWIFRYRTNPWSSALPSGEVDNGIVRVSISLPHDADAAKFKEIYERELTLMRQCVERSRDQIVGYNGSLPGLIQRAVSSRRQRLSRHGSIAALLDIPLATKPGAPSISPVKLEIRRPPPLPVPPKTGLKPEPGITDETYELILRFIRHQGRTFERTPATYAIHGEEDLRNIILAQLNGHFEGAAVGEAFRGRGKTDICVEQENRAAFVGECKLWTGPAGVIAALDQLLGYLTWRDSKAALIVFNSRNKDFSRILDALPAAIRKHSLFLRDLNSHENGEWRLQMRSEEDEGRRVTLHAFAFNLFQEINPGH